MVPCLVIFTTAQIHSNESEQGFYVGFNPQAVIPTGNLTNRFFVEKPFHKTIPHHHTRQ